MAQRPADPAKIAALAGRVLQDWGGAHIIALATSVMHCMTVSLAHNGEGLGNVVGQGTARELAREAGFSRFERLSIEHAFHQLFVVGK